MPKEYRTIREVAGPLMMIGGVENVKYNELGEIELPSGEKRRCRVLEIDGENALVQLFESAAGINLAQSKARFLGRSMELPRFPGYAVPGVRRLGAAHRRRAGADSGKAAGRQRHPDEPRRPQLSPGIYSDRRVCHRRAEHPGTGTEAADFFRFRASPC